MSDYSKLTKKQLLDIISTLESDTPECLVCKENEKDITDLEKQVMDLKQEIIDTKQKEYERARNQQSN